MNSKNALPKLIKADSVTIVFPDGPKTIARGHANFGAVMDAIKKKQDDLLRDLVEVPAAVKAFTQGKCSIVGDQVLFNNEPVSNYVVTKVFDLMREGLPFENLLKFLERLMANPSMRARQELYKFLETENLPITEDGCFLAYKSVRAHTYMDWHSNTKRNAIGDVVTMPRPEVDDNQQVGCSKGLHVGSLSYVENFHNGADAVMVICKVDPADVVCIPVEDVRKIRCCKYEVLNHFTGKFQGSVYDSRGVGPLAGAASTDLDDLEEDVCPDCELFYCECDEECDEDCSLEDDEEWPENLCPQCEEEISPGDKYCWNCGEDLV